MKSPYIAVAVKAARRAASEITRAATSLDTLEVENKSVNDFVTAADRAAEAAIVDCLQHAYPDHAILTEEAGRIGAAKSDYLWIVDPLDGTLNFMHGIPQYAVSIALAYRGEVVAGVIYDVAKNELFTAAKGEGAFLDNRRIRVSDRKDMNRAVIGTGFPFRRSDDFKGYMMSFMRVAERTAGIRRPGSAALDLAYVAAGRMDGFWECGLKEWDVAAGTLLVQEAGGTVTDFHGGEDYLATGDIVGGNLRVHGAILEVVRRLGARPSVVAGAETESVVSASPASEDNAEEAAAGAAGEQPRARKRPGILHKPAKAAKAASKPEGA